jgi:hypothetical protein
MTEHKFGTWYPIEELKTYCKRILFAPVRKKDKIVIGSMTEYKSTDGGNWEDDYEGEDGYSICPTPKLWMPLPPRPGEE